MRTIEIETKPNGYQSSWLIIGPVENGKVIKKGYPHQSKQLTVQREFSGRNASQRIFWRIAVPDGYKWGIAIESNEPRGVGSSRSHEILYQPGQD